MSDRPTVYDAIVLGAGGAGLMSAATAGRRGRKVVVIDHADQPGKKILISGGGHCNFTNRETVPDRFISANPHFAKSALSRYSAQMFIDLVEDHKIAWHEKTLGQLFCDGSAKQIVEMLLNECDKAESTGGHVDIRLAHSVHSVVRQGDLYRVETDKGAFLAPKLVVATGGPSIPKMGATGFAYDLARQFGLKVVEPRPALVPLTLGRDEALFTDLSGVSTMTRVTTGKTSFSEAALFTHKGLSGPAILQISSYWKHGQSIGVNFLPSRTGEWLLALKNRKPKSSLKVLLSEVLPHRLTDVLLERLGLSGPIGEASDKALRRANERLCNWTFNPQGTEGFAKAEVTVGGVSTAGLSSKTMEAKTQPGLYFIGEAVDVTGWLGGYNFQWAWSSGWVCGQEI